VSGWRAGGGWFGASQHCFGCTLGLQSLDVLAITTPSGSGIHSYQIPITITPTLPGLAFHLQVAELDLSAGWIGTYTTNALTCTIGSW